MIGTTKYLKMKNLLVVLSLFCIPLTLLGQEIASLSSDSNEEGETVQQPATGIQGEKVYTEKEMLENRLYNIEHEIATDRDSLTKLQNNITKLGKDINTLKSNWIIIASNFLYLPYDKDGIEKIAIPSFNKWKNYNKESKDENNLVVIDLLNNYEQDIITVLEITDEGERTMKPSQGNMSNTGSVLLNKFSKTDTYKNYLKFTDWKNTYLGKYISQIITLLNTPGDAPYRTFDKIKNNLIKRVDWEPTPPPSPAPTIMDTNVQQTPGTSSVNSADQQVDDTTKGKQEIIENGDKKPNQNEVEKTQPTSEGEEQKPEVGTV